MDFRHPVNGYCLRCEEDGCSTCKTDGNFKLKNISHGTSSADVLQATNQENTDFSDWHDDGVLFLMEGPSKDYGLYQEVEFKGHKKNPASSWYWIHHPPEGKKHHEVQRYPERFKGAEYGGLFNSIVFTFKLKNAYLTNLVKCGLNDDADNYKGLGEYNPKALKICYDNFLTREIEAIKPKVIFCFGTRVYDFLYNQYHDQPFPWQVIKLPHPARGQQGFSDELFRHSYYSMILEGLFQAGIIKTGEAQERYAEFLNLSNRRNG
jgi:hypothetical protein